MEEIMNELPREPITFSAKEAFEEKQKMDKLINENKETNSTTMSITRKLYKNDNEAANDFLSIHNNINELINNTDLKEGEEAEFVKVVSEIIKKMTERFKDNSKNFGKSPHRASNIIYQREYLIREVEILFKKAADGKL